MKSIDIKKIQESVYAAFFSGVVETIQASDDSWVPYNVREDNVVEFYERYQKFMVGLFINPLSNFEQSSVPSFLQGINHCFDIIDSSGEVIELLKQKEAGSLLIAKVRNTMAYTLSHVVYNLLSDYTKDISQLFTFLRLVRLNSRLESIVNGIGLFNYPYYSDNVLHLFLDRINVQFEYLTERFKSEIDTFLSIYAPRCNQCIQFNWKSPNLQSGELQTINKVLDNQHFNKALRGIVSSELKTNNDLCL